MKNPFNAYDDKFVDEISTFAGREKQIAALERARLVAFGMFIFGMLFSLLFEIMGSGGLFQGLAAISCGSGSLCMDCLIKWLKSVDHQQSLNEKNET